MVWWMAENSAATKILSKAMGSCQSTLGVAHPRESVAMGPQPSVLMKFDDITRVYAFEQQLYQGTRSSVHRVKHRGTGMSYACRTIYKSKLCSRQELRDVQQEVRLYHTVARSGSPHIVQFIQSFEEKEFLYIVTEECTGGGLFERILKSGSFSEKEAAEAFAHVASAIEHMHSFGVVHRDIKLENFLYLNDSPDAPLKLIHFKSAVQLTSQDELLDDVVGSVTYVAPEMLRGTGYGKEVDVWSAGVLLYEMLCGYPPFACNEGGDEELFEQIVTCPLDLKSEPWPHISPAAKDLVRQMLTRDPTRRLTAAQVLQHYWFKEQYTAPRTIGHLVLQNLRVHQQYNRFKKAALVLLASTSSKEELGGLMQLFESLDKDKDGTISVEELRKGLIQQGVNVAVTEVATLLASMDADGDKRVDGVEFVAAAMRGLVRQVAEGDDQKRLRAAFGKFDRQGRGYVTREDLRTVLLETGRSLSEQELQQVMAEADTNRDGQIDYEEFAQMMLHGEMQVRAVDEQENNRLHVDAACMERLRTEPLTDLVFDSSEPLNTEQSEKFDALTRRRSRAVSRAGFAALGSAPSTAFSAANGALDCLVLDRANTSSRDVDGGASVGIQRPRPPSSLSAHAQQPPSQTAAAGGARAGAEARAGGPGGSAPETGASWAGQVPATPFASSAVRFSPEPSSQARTSPPAGKPGKLPPPKTAAATTAATMATTGAAKASKPPAALGEVDPAALAAATAAATAAMFGKDDDPMADPRGPIDNRFSSTSRSSAGSVLSTEALYLASGGTSTNSRAGGDGDAAAGGTGGVLGDRSSLTGPVVARLKQVPEEAP